VDYTLFAVTMVGAIFVLGLSFWYFGTGDGEE
jgi:hypothetical protein